MLTQEHLEQIVKDNLSSIVKGFENELSEAVSREMLEQCHSVVGKAVRQWIEENIVPEITKQLVEQKDSLIATAAQLGPLVVKELVEKITEQSKKNLGESWTRKKIMEALFT